MRYWHPMSDAVAAEVKAFGPDDIVLLPLYPQFSSTTTGSSFEDWYRASERVGLTAPTHAICCYPRDAGFVGAVAAILRTHVDEAASKGQPRVLFSAHGLPKRVIAGGDPYQWQIEETVDAVVETLKETSIEAIDHAICYQSRVGPLEWIGPSTVEELERAAKDGVPVVVVPIAFVSEHSETLVELDIEYREVAEELGVVAYVRAPTVCVNETFVRGLAGLVKGALTGDSDVKSGEADGRRVCPAEFSRCVCKTTATGV